MHKFHILNASFCNKTYVHISVPNWYIADICLMHGGIREMGQLYRRFALCGILFWFDRVNYTSILYGNFTGLCNFPEEYR